MKERNNMSKKLLLTLMIFGALSQPALAREKLTFKDMDLNKNGAISVKEMVTATTKRFKKADKNNDKVITTEEVLAMMPFFVRPMARKKVSEYLKSRDLNKNGKTHMDEIMKMAKKKFKAHDKNGDGKLSKDEFKRLQKAKK